MSKREVKNCYVATGIIETGHQLYNGRVYYNFYVEFLKYSDEKGAYGKSIFFWYAVEDDATSKYARFMQFMGVNWNVPHCNLELLLGKVAEFKVGQHKKRYFPIMRQIRGLGEIHLEDINVKPLVFFLEDLQSASDLESYNLPEFIKDKIKSSEEWKEIA